MENTFVIFNLTAKTGSHCIALFFNLYVGKNVAYVFYVFIESCAKLHYGALVSVEEKLVRS